jgi:hypothetical protein
MAQLYIFTSALPHYPYLNSIADIEILPSNQDLFVNFQPGYRSQKFPC